MLRRNFLKNSALCSGVLITPANKVLLDLLGSSAFDMQLIRNNVGFFSERGGTIGWMISEGGIVVIDSQYEEQANHLIEEIQKESAAMIDYLINTHHHGDHTSGNIAFKDVAKHVLAHTNSKANQMRVAKERNKEENQLYPDLTFTDSWSQKIGDEVISMSYFGPAHTDGDALIHFENANVVHMGDLVFNRRFPYIDKSAGASIENWARVLRKAADYYDRDTVYIFGHAGASWPIKGSLDDLLAFANYLEKLLLFVGSLHKAGKSQEEVMKFKSIPGAEEWKGDGIERSLSTAYQEVTER